MGTIRKLSCDWPNIEPLALATPTISNTTPSAVIVCPIGLVAPAKNLSLRSRPMNATFMWRSFSISERKRPSSASILLITPILGDAPCKPTFSDSSVPRCTVTLRPALVKKFVFFLRQLGIAPQHFEVFLGVEAHHHDALHGIPIGAHTGDILCN